MPDRERLFLPWDEPALPALAARLADRFATEGELDLSGVAVVLAGSRPARRLKELLLESATERGLRLVPPRVTTVGQLPELLYEPPFPAIDPLASRMLWAEALQRVHRDGNMAPVFPHPPEEKDVRGWHGLAADVQRLHTEVARGGHRFRDVSARIGSDRAGGFSDAERWAALSAVEHGYEALLTETRRLDPGMARIDTVDQPLRFEGDLWLVGLAEMPRIARLMLQRVETPLVFVVHAPEEESAAFDDLGCVRVEVWKEREVAPPDDELRICDRPTEQADMILAEIAELEDDLTADDLAIAVPDADLAPFIEQRLEERGIPARNAAGIAISRTPTYTFLATAAEYLNGGGRWDAFATLLRHPDTIHLLKETSPSFAIIQADRYFSTRLPSIVTEGMPPVLSAARRAFDELLRPLRTRLRLSQWGSVLVEVLASLYGDLSLDRGRPLERRRIDVLHAFRDAAAAFMRLPATADVACDGVEALQLLLDSVRTASIPEDPDRAAVELLGWLEMHLDDAPVAFITGFNEPFLPESVVSDAFLPDSLRTRLGLLDNDTRYARDAYHLTAIRHSRRTRWIAGRMSADGDPLRPSRLMLAVPEDHLAERVLNFARPARSGPRPVVPPQRRAAPESAFRLPPERELVFEPPTEIRVTAFRALLENPFLFVLTQTGKLEAVDDLAREMDGALFGSIAHDVLRDFSSSAAGRSTDPRGIEECLGDLLSTRARRTFGDGSMMPAVRLQIEYLRRRLGAFARWQASWAADGWETILVEGVPVSESGDGRTLRVPFPVDDQPIILRGRIDRVDRHVKSGRYVVLDYKTGDKALHPEKTHRKGRRDAKTWIDLQLPLYRHLLSLSGPDGEVPFLGELERDTLGLGYVVLPRTLDDTAAHIAEWSIDDLLAADEAACEAVRLLRTGRVAFDAAAKTSFLDGRTSALLGLRQLVGADDENDDDDE